MAYVNMNLLYDFEYTVPLDSSDNEIRDQNVAQLVNDMGTRNLRDQLNGNQVVMFSVTGAWRQRHKIDDYQANATEIKATGVDKIICHVVDDPWAVYAWAGWLNCPDIEFIPDGNGSLAMRMAALTNMSVEDCGNRAWQYSAFIDNGVIEYWNEEPNKPIEEVEPGDPNTDITNATTATDMLEWLQSDSSGI